MVRYRLSKNLAVPTRAFNSLVTGGTIVVGSAATKLEHAGDHD